MPRGGRGLALLDNVAAADAHKVAGIAAVNARRGLFIAKLGAVAESEDDGARFEYLAADGADLIAGVAALETAGLFLVFELRLVLKRADVVLFVALSAGAGIGGKALGDAGRGGHCLLKVMLMILKHTAADAYAALIAVAEHFRIAVGFCIAAGAFVNGIAVCGAGRRSDGIDIAVRMACKALVRIL